MLTPIPRQPRRVTAGLSSARSDKGLTIKALAGQLKVSYHHLCKIERGHKRPSDDLLLRLAKALDVDLDAISTREPVEDAARPFPTPASRSAAASTRASRTSLARGSPR